MITQTINLNLIPGRALPRINATQFDYGSRTLTFAIYNGDQRFTLASLARFAVLVKLPSGMLLIMLHQ